MSGAPGWIKVSGLCSEMGMTRRTRLGAAQQRLPMIAAEGDEVQIVSAMPAFQTRRHTSSVEAVVARRSDHRPLAL